MLARTINIMPVKGRGGAMEGRGWEHGGKGAGAWREGGRHTSHNSSTPKKTKLTCSATDSEAALDPCF